MIKTDRIEKESYFKEASLEMIRARCLCQLANETPIDDLKYVSYLEKLFNRKLDDIRILTPFICDFGNRVVVYLIETRKISKINLALALKDDTL